MGDTSLEHDRTVAERKPDVVKGVDVKREGGFDLRAVTTDFLDRHRLKDHDFAVELARISIRSSSRFSSWSGAKGSPDRPLSSDLAILPDYSTVNSSTRRPWG